MSTFVLKIEMGNDAMITVNDLSEALRIIADRISDYPNIAEMNHYKNIMDINGNIVGKFAVKGNCNIIEVD